MRTMIKLFGVLLLVVLAWLAVVASGWLPRPTQAQLDAIALLEQAPARVTGERNAFAALWSFSYAVPEAEWEEHARADAAAFAQASTQGEVKGFRRLAEGKYQPLPSPRSNDPALCDPWGGDCLPRVRQDPAATRARLTEFALRLERGDRLAAYDHHRYGFRPRLDAPIVGPGPLFALQLSAAALEHVEGRSDAAFARLCRDTATWRRLRRNNDALIIDMLGVAQMTGAAHLYAEMLAEQPGGFAPPCPQAFAPLADAEIDHCVTHSLEYQMARNTVDDGLLADVYGGERWSQRAWAALVNEEHVNAAAAPSWARSCGPENQARIARRDPAPLAYDPPCGTLDWFFDPAGCEAFLIAIPAYNDYYQRVLDLDARLKLLQTALWLRDQPPDGERAAQFAARPAALHAAHHDMRLDAAANRLRMTNLQHNRGAEWDIPLAVPLAAALAAPSAPAAAASDSP